LTFTRTGQRSWSAPADLRLSKLPGFSGYYLVEAERGVMTSISFFDSQEHADESTRLAVT
jgi:hypothetical protein